MTTSRSLTSGWETQNTTKQVMNYQWAKQMRLCLRELWITKSNTFCSVFQPFFISRSSVTIWPCPYLGTSPRTYSWENSLCKLFFILCQMNPIQLNPIFFDGCHRFFIPFTAAAAASLQSCPTLCDPADSSPPGSAFPGILQARTLEWVAMSFSNAWKWKVKVKSLSRVQLIATHGLQPTRLLRPWDFPGKSTGVGCHCLLPSHSQQEMYFTWWQYTHYSYITDRNFMNLLFDNVKTSSDALYLIQLYELKKTADHDPFNWVTV